MEPWMLFGLFVAVFLWGIVGLRVVFSDRLPKWKWLSDAKALIASAVMCILGFGGWLTIGFYTESSISWLSPRNPKHVLRADFTAAQYDGSGAYVQSGSWLWCVHGCINDLPVSMDVESRVSPITENPKVRRLTYVVRTRLTDPRAYAAALSLNDDWKNVHRAAGAVLSELYEFNNTQSKTLAEFYNPLDVRQTNGLAELLKREIDPRLKSKGMEITELVSWEVE